MVVDSDDNHLDKSKPKFTSEDNGLVTAASTLLWGNETAILETVAPKPDILQSDNDVQSKKSRPQIDGTEIFLRTETLYGYHHRLPPRQHRMFRQLLFH